MSNPIIDSITLYSQKGGSDKVYMLQIEEVEDGMHMVYYANGKRGASLKMKPKTSSPVTPKEARAEFDKTVKSKKKGSSKYQESLDNGDTLKIDENAGESSGIDVQLLNEITEAEAIDLCHDPLWTAQEKFDGERRPLIIEDKTVRGTNRYGEYTGGIKSSVAEGIDLATSMILDTEDLGDHLRAFDILSYRGKDLKSLPFIERFEILIGALAKHQAIILSPLATTTEQKLALLEKMKKENREGMVFKRAESPYIGGRPSKGGDQLKFKLYDEASVIVSKVNTKRSVLMEIIDTDGSRVTVGNVTIPANAEIPAVGDIIEVKYLYAYKGGSLYQPSLIKPRPDLRTEECVIGQLKYKPSAD